MESLATLALSATTIGKDLTDRLSKEESACVRAELGDASYRAFEAGPFVAELQRAYERPLIERDLLNTLFNCVSPSNVQVLGLSVMEAHAGGWTEHTRSCANGIVEDHAEIVYLWLGLDREFDAAIEEHVQTTHTFFLDLWDCFTDMEKVEFTVHSWSVSEGVNGADLMSGILTGEELSCLNENLPEGSLDQISKVGSLAETFVIPGVAAASQVCLGPDIYNRLFVGGFAKRTDGLSQESAACILQFTIDHSHYMALAQSRNLDISTLSIEELAETADDGRRLLECLTEEELASYQNSFGDRWYR